jgi:hypothetical protein
MRSKSIPSVVALSAALIVMVPAPSSDDPTSRDAAATLTRLLDQHHLDAIATRDPQDPDRFIAALYFPGAQLLVIRGTYAAPELLAQRIDQRQYRDAYADIGAASRPEGRCFVMDLHADGLYANRDREAPLDIVYRNGTDQAVYDGDWKRQQLTRSAYFERFALDDAEYARMLSALAASLSTMPRLLHDASKRDT